MFNAFITNISQKTLMLGYFVTNLQTKLTISCEKTNTFNDSKGSLHIRYN